MTRLQALLFDCDGTLAETERDGHRVAYNQAFEALGLPFAWSEDEYGELLAVAGGRERLTYYFERAGWPVPAAERKSLLDRLHGEKTKCFLAITRSGKLPPCAGVAELAQAALHAGVAVAICSTSHPDSVRAVADAVFGTGDSQRIGVYAGDMVPEKKPHPGIYHLAARELGVSPDRCVVVEDSAIGLAAALGAGMHCIVTPSEYTRNDDFRRATRIVKNLGEITLSDCEHLCQPAAKLP